MSCLGFKGASARRLAVRPAVHGRCAGDDELRQPGAAHDRWGRLSDVRRAGPLGDAAGCGAVDRGRRHRRSTRCPRLSATRRRAGLGLARTGSFASHGSGEIFIAFATGPGFLRREFCSKRGSRQRGRERSCSPRPSTPPKTALNSMFMATTAVGYRGHTMRALPIDETVTNARRATVSTTTRPEPRRRPLSATDARPAEAGPLLVVGDALHRVHGRIPVTPPRRAFAEPAWYKPAIGVVKSA